MYTDAQLKFRHLVCTIVVFGTLLVFVTCFVHIFAVVRRANADVVGFQSGSLPPYVSRNFNGNVSRIAISQVKGRGVNYSFKFQRIWDLSDFLGFSGMFS